jgi:hypothetical protein
VRKFLFVVACIAVAPSLVFAQDAGLPRPGASVGTERKWRELSFEIETRGKVERLVVNAEGSVALGDVKKERFLSDGELARLDAAVAKADLPTLPAWTADDEFLAARTSTIEVRSTDQKGASSRWRASLEKTRSTDRLSELLAIAAGISRRLRTDDPGELARLVKWNRLESRTTSAAATLEETVRIDSDRRVLVRLGAKEVQGRLSDDELVRLDQAIAKADLPTFAGDAPAGAPATIHYSLATGAGGANVTLSQPTAKTNPRVRAVDAIIRAIVERLKKQPATTPPTNEKTPGFADTLGGTMRAALAPP